MQVRGHVVRVIDVVATRPQAHGLAQEQPVRKYYVDPAADLQDTTDLLQHLQRFGQVVDAQLAQNDVEGLGVVFAQPWVVVQVLDDPVRQDLVALELLLVHAQSRDSRRLGNAAGIDVAGPARAKIEHRCVSGSNGGVGNVVRHEPHGVLVHVLYESRVLVKDRIGLAVQPGKLCFPTAAGGNRVFFVVPIGRNGRLDLARIGETDSGFGIYRRGPCLLVLF
mmetsp:Transcript_45240/g.94162  ORF Transcript_45240/g.94162 Transcript_45240/m.94162 type:complete len:222 (+) Transcript_45240:174-839(+)